MDKQIPEKTQTANSLPGGQVGISNGANPRQHQTNNMNMLLTQIFPNNNYTAKHQSLIGQNKLKKKVKSYEGSHSPPRQQNVKLQNHSANIDNSYQHANLANVKLRMPHQRNDSYNQNVGQGMVVPSNMMDNHNGKGGGVMQNRRGLMETSNMFSVYRNSLKTGNGSSQ